MNYFIGIDGGGTKSTGVITDYNLNVIHRLTGGPTNYHSIGADEAVRNIFNLINKLKKILIISDEDIASVCIGTAGAGRDEDVKLITKKIEDLKSKEKCRIKNIKVISDVEITLEGAFNGNSGIVLIAGTGSICYGKNEKGKIFRVGGNGKILGDEGSGYSIGLKGLRKALRSFDGRCLGTSLLNNIFEFMDVKSPDEVIRKVYKENFNIASLAEVVISSAEKEDEAAINILHEEAEELLFHLYAILPKINEIKNHLSLSGSLLTNKNIFKDFVLNRIKKVLTNVEIVEPQNPPEIGAAIIAKKNFY